MYVNASIQDVLAFKQIDKKKQRDIKSLCFFD